MYSRHNGIICPKPSSSSSRFLKLIPADTLCRNDASSQTFVNRIGTVSRYKFWKRYQKFYFEEFTLDNTPLDTEYFCLSCPLSRRIVRTNTELVYGVNDSEQELGVRSIRIEVYGDPAILLFQISTDQSTDTLEYWMTCIIESFHHSSGCRIPFSFRCARKSSIPLLFVSRTEKRPVFLRESLRVLLDFFCEFEKQISSFPFFVQSMSLNIDMKMIPSVNLSGSMFRFRKSLWIS